MSAHRTAEQLQLGLAQIQASPRAEGRVQLLVRRPASEVREVLEEAQLDPDCGLVGDVWGGAPGHKKRRSPDTQLTLMNARCIALLAGDPEQWPPAGDQLYVDLDLSTSNLPPGTQLRVGSAVLEVTSVPHRGCRKFQRRFGAAALAFVDSPLGRELNLRGVYARVLTPGVVKRGDPIEKVRRDQEQLA